MGSGIQGTGTRGDRKQKEQGMGTTTGPTVEIRQRRKAAEGGGQNRVAVVSGRRRRNRAGVDSVLGW